MEDGSMAMLMLKIIGFAGLAAALLAHQVWCLKKFQLKMREKERAAEAEMPQAG